MTETEIGYAEAIAELDAILADLESDDIDIDVLAAKVERAAELIRLCQGRIATARVQVEKVVADLDGLDDTAAGSDGDMGSNSGSDTGSDDATLLG